MFLVKRDNFNKNFIIKGFTTSILLSAFIYLSHFNIEYLALNSILGVLAIYFLVTIPRKSLFITGFTTGIFWFYWIAVSLQYYELTYLVPVLLIVIGLAYGILFSLFGLINNILYRVIAIFAFTFIAPFGFNWMKFELLFIDSYFNTTKESFALILAAVLMASQLKRLKILALVPLFIAFQSPQGEIIDNPNLDIHLSQFNIPQDLKWKKENRNTLINKNLNEIDKAISLNKDLVVLPETSIPIVLNNQRDLLNFLKEKSYEITIFTGGLYLEDQKIYNATYLFSKGEVQIAKKVVLVPFGEEIPLPKFFVDLINNTFYGGASDYSKASKATDFIINGTKIRNAICYEATTDKIFENLNDTKYMIAISNNAWFTPSTEPTLQKLLMKYYAKKYGVTIFHVVNGSQNYVIRP
ncbi:apolipoprotein N-acyltransferase [Arcobacter roscoffensis]|uniref:Apolipoprotein N-acyltransferase n=1 Tax=Arcobacter roscoffensis TaxID=2961520 RepID=A0ABY5E5K1_9BACT|nr:apolipoprotein N-acyltransferase [Arcobacter roscoffensis]UTJ07020.1 apolipoprotein N-acyltransferase [Arcobacter roscoffensis]